MAISIKITFDFQFSTAYTSRFVPMNFRQPNNCTSKLHLDSPFALPPAPAAIEPAQPRQLTNRSASSDRLDITEIATDSEIHVLRIGPDSEPRNPPPNGPCISCGDSPACALSNVP